MLKISDLIKQATDILVSQGNLFVELKISDDRFRTKYIDIERRNTRTKENILVIKGSDKDNFK